MADQPRVFEADQHGELKPVTKYIPPPSPGWVRRNFTMGNVLTIVSMLMAAIIFTMTWARATELADVQFKGRLESVEFRLTKAEQETMSRETIAVSLEAIERRLGSIERRLDANEARRAKSE